jgi:RNA polymerase sigma factor (sigma-70 family)
MSNDTGLLRQYVEQRSEAAFSELVREHLNLVYSAAWRETNGDTALAEDLAQEVFTELAGKAPKLLRHPSLAGWLYTTVRHLAANVRRSNQRRRQREATANLMNELDSDESPEAVWQQVRPVLDDALHEMKESDRIAIVLRFLENRSLREVGEALGLQENAARMRVDRALEKLRGLLARRGITSTGAGLAGALAVGVILPAPSAFAATVASTALASSVVAGSTTLSFVQIMTLSKVQISVASVLVIAGIAVPAWQQTRLQAARSEAAALQTQVAEVSTLREEVGRLRAVEADRAELERLRQYQAEVQPELVRLRGMAGAARRANAEVAELRAQQTRAASAGASNGLASGPMGELMRLGMEQDAVHKLGRMTAAIHLTPEQAGAVQEILKRQARVSSASMEQVMSGKFSQEELTKLAKDAGNPEQQISALLTPEQRTAYKAFQEEEKARTAQTAAHMELVQLNTSLSLTPEQQDQVFGALYQTTLNQYAQTNTPKFTSSAEQMQWAFEQKAKALEPLLSTTQLASYRQQQELQLKFLKEIESKMRPK